MKGLIALVLAAAVLFSGAPALAQGTEADEHDAAIMKKLDIIRPEAKEPTETGVEVSPGE